ncbi:MAG: caspase family protein [Leptolyngbya sp.]|nr:caspase family protein [Leptolyngbya sp.]
MASHWPVIVGINQYQQLQPLMYAQFDAIELRDFLVQEAGLAPEACALLTDVSPMVYQGAAFPSREVLLQRLSQTVAKAEATDTILFFFSGYGVSWEGQDYLLPIDADPSRIMQTGILISDLFKTLTEGAPSQVLVMLDMNRPQSAIAPSRLGQQTLELAKDLDIPLLLSCQPQEFSQETLAVRHGLFTEAMVEGLRFHGCLTLTQIADYLANRVPELCRHHWRPEQHPVAVIPAAQRFLMLVPPAAAGNIAGGPSLAPPMPSEGASPMDGPMDGPMLPQGAGDIAPALTTLADEDRAATSPDSSGAPARDDTPPQPGVEDSSPDRATASLGWPQWAFLAAGVLLFGVLLRHQTVFWGNRPPSPEPPATPQTTPTGEGSQPPPGEPPTPEVDPPANPLFPSTDIDGPTALGLARKALAERQFGEAITWLNQIPEGERPEDFDALLAQAEVGQTTSVVTGEVILDDARRLVEPVSASLFNDAIERARQVPVDDPLYDQAQADIARWSQVMLDLAEGRAASGNFDGAIAAAALVPGDQSETYAQAQAAIQRWQQRKTNRQLLQQAQAMLQPDQATSFKEAIALAQQVPPDFPEYAVAQDRISQWSQDILAIARSRAAAGDVAGAIAAAERVPPETSAYDQAQQDIQTWQGQ